MARYSNGLGSVNINSLTGSRFVKVYGTGVLTSTQREIIRSVDMRMMSEDSLWNAIRYHFGGFIIDSKNQINNKES